MPNQHLYPLTREVLIVSLSCPQHRLYPALFPLPHWSEQNKILKLIHQLRQQSRELCLGLLLRVELPLLCSDPMEISDGPLI